MTPELLWKRGILSGKCEFEAFFSGSQLETSNVEKKTSTSVMPLPSLFCFQVAHHALPQSLIGK